MELLIIRHAQSFGNARLTTDLDSGITDVGREQAKQTAKWVAENFDLSEYVGITSPYLRTLQTARYISEEGAGPWHFSVRPGVREYHIQKDHPQLTPFGGMRLPIRESEFGEFVWFESKPLFFTNETIPQLITRVQDFFNGLALNREAQSKYLIVSHGAPCRVLIDTYLGKDLSYLERRYSDDPAILDCNAGGTKIPNCSVTHLVDGRCECLAKVAYQ